MGISRGKNNGVAGILSVLVDGAGSPPPFAVFVKSHNGAVTFRSKSRRGRGSAGAPLVRITGQDGSGTVTGKMPVTGWPSPDHPEYYVGTLTIVMQTQQTAGSPPSPVDKVDIPVRITKLTFGLSDPDTDEGPGEDEWDITAEWTMTGLPVWTWQGTQVTVTAPSPSTLELYDGLQKIYDVNGLVTGAIQRIDCDQVADDDLSEATKLAAVVAAATTPPMPNLKVVSAAWSRPGEDGQGGEIVLTWGLQDSRDEIETPQNVQEIDPNALRDQRTLAQVWTVPGAAPPTPTPPSGLKIITYRDTKRNDQKMVRLWTFGRTDSKDDVLLPKNFTDVDPNAITTRAGAASINATPTLPSGIKLRSTYTVNLNDGSVLKVAAGGLTDTKDDLLNPHTQTNTDPTGLTTTALSAVAFVPGSPPADPTPPTGLKLRHKDDLKINDGLTKRVYEHAKTDTGDDVILPKTFLDLDPSAIATRASAAGLNTTPTLPSGIGLKVRSTYTVNLNSVDVLNVVAGGMTSTIDDILNPKIRTNTDPRGLTTTAQLAVSFVPGTPPADPTPPTGLKLRHKDDGKVNDGLSTRAYEYAITDTLDELLLPKNFTDIDPNGIGTRGSAAALNSVPTLPAGIGLKVRSTHAVNINPSDVLNVVEGAENDTVDDLFNAHARAFRSAQAPYRDTVPSLYPSTASAQTVADATWSTFQSQANAFGLTVLQISPSKKLVLYEYVNPGILVEGYGMGGGRVINGQLSGGNVQLYVMQNLSRGSGTRLVVFSRYRTNKPLRRFVVRRLFTQAPPMPDFSGLFGYANNASFLGLSAGTVLYDGPVFTTNIALSGTLPFFMGYQFSADANGHFIVPDDLFGTAHFLTTSSTTQRDWVNASAIGMGSVITQPPQGDFSGFVS